LAVFQEIVLGQAHAGGSTFLNNIMGKTYEQIFTELRTQEMRSPTTEGR